MEERLECAVLHLVLEDRRSIVFGLAAVDDKRQAGFASSSNVDAEAPGLYVAGAEVVVVIEPCLTEANDLGMAGELHEIGRRDIGLFGRMMRMSADSAPDIVMGFSDRQHLADLFSPCTDGNHKADARLLGAREYAIEIFNEAVALQLEEIFKVDSTNTVELTWEQWRGRHAMVKFSETVLTPFRPLL